MEWRWKQHGIVSLGADALKGNEGVGARRWGMRILALGLFIIPEPIVTNFLGSLLLLASFSPRPK